jgi:hypothetical protein
MVRKASPLSYEGLTIAPDQAVLSESQVSPVATAAPTPRAKSAGSSMRDLSAPFTLYLHPDGAKALKRYALEQDTKVHTLLLDAVEDWFRRKGLREAVRVKVEQTSRKGSA